MFCYNFRPVQGCFFILSFPLISPLWEFIDPGNLFRGGGGVIGSDQGFLSNRGFTGKKLSGEGQRKHWSIFAIAFFV